MCEFVHKVWESIFGVLHLGVLQILWQVDPFDWFVWRWNGISWQPGHFPLSSLKSLSLIIWHVKWNVFCNLLEIKKLKMEFLLFSVFRCCIWYKKTRYFFSYSFLINLALNTLLKRLYQNTFFKNMHWSGTHVIYYKNKYYNK